MNPVFRNVFDIPLSHVFERGKFDPALGFDLSSALSAGITFTRASDGTAFDAAGVLQTYSTDVARFEYSNGQPQGLLLEPQRENLCFYSADFGTGWLVSTAGTGVGATITTDAETAPDGNTTADLIVFDTGGGTTSSDLVQLTSNSISCTAATAYTMSFWAKTSDGSSKTYVIVHPRGASAFVTIGANWQRYTFTATSATTGSGNLRFRARGNTTETQVSSIYLWGMQFEEGTEASSYIATTSASVTRAVDSATFSTDLTTSGTILIEHDVPSGGVILGEGANTVLTSTGAGTLAISFDGTRSQSCLNGGAVSSGAGLTLGATLRLLGSSAVQSIGHVKRYQEFDRIMSGAELRQISK